MSDGHKFVELMRKASKTPENEVVDLVMGTVISIDPIRIKIGDVEVPSQFIILSPLCFPRILNLETHPDSHTHSITDSMGGSGTASTNTHNHSIEIVVWEGVRIGDNVMMLKVGKGQKYYVLHKQGGL